ncbi:hypothetical protein ACFJIW_16265 [Tahibacter sp. UC22_41]|uniref:hypothetical protein n=1 Tax=Tahibacter sp. UC22_41 TaxID=3350178 RepID=UPI0036DC185B
MDILTARPERLLGNVALASLMAGLPVGLIFAIAGLATQPLLSSATWSAGFGSLLLAPVLVFIAGLILLPVLYALRKVGYAGPLSVYVLSTLFSLVLMSNDMRAGLLGLVLSLPASFVFCRYAYRSGE